MEEEFLAPAFDTSLMVQVGAKWEKAKLHQCQ